MTSNKKQFHFKEYFHWLFLVAPLLSIFISSYWEIDRTTAEYIIIPAAIAINLIIICVKSYVDATEGQSPIRTFFTDDLLPNKKGKKLLYNIEITVIEGEESEAVFCNQLEERFNDEFKKSANHKSVINPNLRFRAVAGAFANKKDAEDGLDNDLANSKAVVVIRTKDLEKKPWVYEALDEWAYKRSDVPILFTELSKEREDELKNEDIEISPIPDRYFSIPDEPNSLPWRLLQRSTERGLTWRNQASFNTLIATNVFAFLIMSFLISHLLITRQSNNHLVTNTNQRNEYLNATAQLYQAMRTREEYKNLIGQPDNNDLDVSYWIRYEGKPHVYVTTEDDTNLMFFDDDKQSIIGCATAYHNSWAQWNIKDGENVNVWNFSHEKIQNSGCHMWHRPNKPIESIVCATYNPPPFDPNQINPDYTVGVCVFAGAHTTETDSNANQLRKSIFVGKYLEFLKDKAKTFFEFASPLIKSKQITPLAKRFA